MAELNIIGRVLVGSRLYGTAHDQSDWDYRSVFWEDPESMIGLAPPQDKPVPDPMDHVDTSGKVVDAVAYPVRRAAHLFFACNPNMLDILFARPLEGRWQFSRAPWVMLHHHRQTVLCQRVRHTYVGYAHQKLKAIQQRVAAGGVFDTKDAGHLLRLVRQGCHILQHGDFDPTLTGEDLEVVRAALAGHISAGDLVALAEEGVERIKTMPSALPEEPDRGPIGRLIMSYHTTLVAGQAHRW